MDIMEYTRPVVAIVLGIVGCTISIVLGILPQFEEVRVGFAIIGCICLVILVGGIIRCLYDRRHNQIEYLQQHNDLEFDEEEAKEEEEED